MVDRMPKFYNDETGYFSIEKELQVSKFLGEDVDNPKATFHQIENILDDRISVLSSKMYDIKKIHDSQKLESDSATKDVNDDYDNIEKELYYTIKNKRNELEDELKELNSKTLLLQNQITGLKKDKIDLICQIELCSNRLDTLEKDLGINLTSKRNKKVY